MQVGDKVRVKNAASYFAYMEGLIIARDDNHTFPVSVDLDKWPKPVNFNASKLMVIP